MERLYKDGLDIKESGEGSFRNSDRKGKVLVRRGILD